MANANVYGTVVDRYAAWAADVIQLINGEITEERLERNQRREHIENARQRWHQKLSPEKLANFQNLFHDRTKHLSDDEYLVERPLHAVNENVGLLKDLGFDESYLMTEDVLRMMAGPELYQPDPEISDEAWERARPSNWGRSLLPEDTYRPNLEPSDGHEHAHHGSIHSFAQKEDFMGRQTLALERWWNRPSPGWRSSWKENPAKSFRRCSKERLSRGDGSRNRATLGACSKARPIR